MDKHKEFGAFVTDLIQKKDLTREQSYDAFSILFNNETSDLQQGAFLAGLVAKGESEDEVAGCWEAIYQNDTIKVDLGDSIVAVDNCGTGMDTFKTFNVSTAASIVAASGGVSMARHGARAITSVCGTVDIAEALGVDVECCSSIVTDSIKKSNLGLFNGMSPEIHPAALGRILSQIHFGTTLNISASLANPALPKVGVRGVYKKELLVPVLKVMKEIGYTDAITLYGSIKDSEFGMDEASVSGITYGAELLPSGEIKEFAISSSDLGLGSYDAEQCSPLKNIDDEVLAFLKPFVSSEKGARTDMIILNAAFVLKVAGKAENVEVGIEMAGSLLSSGEALQTLKNWVATQSRNPEEGSAKLDSLLKRVN
ncbi:MAG: anthranilate phosphoribosyltransferase [Psychromonas sp.]|nr:anthranilate phosphoribosyltransferase [Alteromonadales bacterium]MCP5079525.1 anthranilate phosphoribosyltransferase [Psychromonas sp.]